MDSGRSRAYKERLLFAGTKVLPYSLLAHVETFARIGLGKGSGTGDIDREVEACLGFLPPDIDAYVALDIGANAGDWTSALLKRSDKAMVYSFEPSLHAYTTLASRFHGDPRQISVPLAIGSKPGPATLWADRSGSGLGSLVQRNLAHLSLDFDHSESIEVDSLDNWCAKSGVQPTLIKLDVEGYELEVIKGGSETLRDVRVLQFEFGGCNIDSRVFFRDLYAALMDLRFNLARITPRGILTLKSYDQSCEVFETTNYVAYR